LPQEKQIEQYREGLTRLPELNRIVIERLAFLLFLVQANQGVNRMTVDALSIVFGQMSGMISFYYFYFRRIIIVLYFLIFSSFSIFLCQLTVDLYSILLFFYSICC
jgi:hypothetical protein